jgi:16S rRNA (adenine1518-N6/adenine1519-N6)-dimethyltransferase
VPEHVTPSVAKDLLRRHRLRAGRRFGQHFLVDPNTVRRIVRLAELQPDATVLEIGPGLGSLTVALSAAAKRVVAVEVDGRVAEALTEVVGGLRNVDVVVGDALEVDLGALAGAGARLVSNLPYNVATPILMRVLERVPQITGGLVMTQRELGRRWVAGPGDPDVGAVSLRVAYHARARIIGDVPATVFLPPPKVSSVLVAFERHDPPVDVTDEASFFALVRDAFGRRRKTIRNSLVGAGWDTARIDAALADARIEPRQRPERLGLFDFARLHAALR